VILTVALSTLLAVSPLTASEERGRKIFRTGEGSAPITAVVGAEDVPVPASVVPCASCHGRDGRGRAEGGLRPSNLQELTRPYEVATAEGRKHPPYDARLLKRAIAMGIDPAGNRLLPAMPRYRLSMQDANDLVAYMEKLGSDRDPGLTDDALTIGVILPGGEEGDAVRASLAAYYGGLQRLFGRKLDVRFTTSADVAAFIAKEQPFAITAASIADREDEIAKVIAAQHVPTIASISARGGDADGYLFHLLAGIEEQSLALARTTEGPLRIAHGPATAAIAQRIAARLGDRIANDATTVLLLDAPVDARAKTILIPAPFAAPSVFDFDGRALIALPAVTNGAPHATTRAAALAAAQLLTRALERAGRDVDRESLVATLNTFRDEATGLTPPVTWTKSSHVGTTEVSIVRVDAKRHILVPVK